MRDVLAVILVLLPVVDWATALMLLAAAHRNPGITALSERAHTALLLALSATLAGTLGLVRLGEVYIPNDVAILLLGISLVLVSLPALYWLVLYLTGRFGGDDVP